MARLLFWLALISPHWALLMRFAKHPDMQEER